MMIESLDWHHLVIWPGLIGKSVFLWMGTPILVLVILGMATVDLHKRFKRFKALFRFNRKLTHWRLAGKILLELGSEIPVVVYQYRLQSDGSPKILFISEGACQIYGINPKNILADSWQLWNCIIPEDLSVVQESIRNAGEKMVPWMLEHRIVDTEGHLKWVRATAQPQLTEDEGIIWNGVIVDITNTQPTRSLQNIFENESLPVNSVVRSEDAKTVLSLNKEMVLQRQVEEALRLSEARLSLILNSVSDLIVLLKVESSRHYRIIVANQAFLKSTDYSSEQAIGKRLEEVLPKSFAAFQIEKTWEALQLRKSIVFEKEESFPDEKRWIEATITPVFDANRECSHILCLYHDVTKRKQAEDARKHSEERLRLALKAANMGTWEWDTSTNEVKLSIDAESVFGLLPGAFKGTYDAYLKLIHPEDREMVIQTLNDYLTDPDVDSNYYIQHRIMTSEGEVRWLESCGRAFYSAGDKSCRMFGAVSNITERRQAAEELALSEARLLEAQRIAKVGSFEQHIEKDILYCSKELYHILEFDSGEKQIRFRSFLERVHPEDRRSVEQAVDNAFRSGHPLVMEYRIGQPGKKIKFISAYAEIIKDVQGNPERLVGTAQDITERRQSKVQLERFRAILDQAGEAILVVEPDSGQIIDVNQTALQLLGYARNELLHLRVQDIESGYLMGSSREWSRQIAELRASDNPYVSEKNYLSKGGGPICWKFQSP